MCMVQASLCNRCTALAGSCSPRVGFLTFWFRRASRTTLPFPSCCLDPESPSVDLGFISPLPLRGTGEPALVSFSSTCPLQEGGSHVFGSSMSLLLSLSLLELLARVASAAADVFCSAFCCADVLFNADTACCQRTHKPGRNPRTSNLNVTLEEGTWDPEPLVAAGTSPND